MRRQKQETVYSLTESQILDIIQNYGNTQLLENRYGKLGKFLAGAAVAGSTLLGGASCTPMNAPEYPGNSYSQTMTDGISEMRKRMQGDQEFLNKAHETLMDMEDGSFMIYGKLDHSDLSYYAPNCAGNYIFMGILKEGDDVYSARTIRCHKVETFNEFDKYDVVTAQQIKDVDKKNSIIEITVDDSHDENGNCKVSPYTKFFEEWLEKEGWDNGMERVYDAWISLDHEYFVQTIKCDDVDAHKFHIENHQVSNNKYMDHEKGYGAVKGVVYDSNDTID